MLNDRVSHLFCVYLQVLKAKFALCQYIAQNIKTFSKRSAFYALDGLVDKIGDVKVRSSLIWLHCLRFAVFTISHNLFLWLPTNYSLFHQLKDVSKETLTTFAVMISLNYISLKVRK